MLPLTSNCLLASYFCDPQAAFTPNHFLGTCLDEAWVSRMEATLRISRHDRDALGRLVHPFLQPALAHPRFKVKFLCSDVL